VLIVHNRYRSAQPSGENAVVEEELRLLREHGVDAELFTVESDEIAGWPPHRRAALPATVVWSRRGAGLVTAAIERQRPDVVHFHNTFPLLSPAALLAAHRTGVAVVKTLHNFRPLCPAGTLFRDGSVCEECVGRAPLPALRHACYRGSRLATAPLALADAIHGRARTWQRAVDRFILPSEFARSRYLAAGWPADQMVVKFNTAPEPEARREGPGRGFVCLARLGPEKGVDVLLSAWARAFPDGGEGLTVIGSGDLEARLRAQAAGLAGVEFTGQLPGAEALARVREARAVVMPSVWYEVFPRTVVEAYSLGVPVVASRLGSLAEIVREGQTGTLFGVGDPASLAGELAAFDDDRSLTLGLGARAAYERLFHPDVTTARLLGIYEQVADGPGVPRLEVPA
jgi:glycosyltransferase involved in cell wall biosynthesis